MKKCFEDFGVVDQKLSSYQKFYFILVIFQKTNLVHLTFPEPEVHISSVQPQLSPSEQIHLNNPKSGTEVHKIQSMPEAPHLIFRVFMIH